MEKVIVKPLITEKMTAKSEKLGQYGFVVDKKANKLQVKSAVEKMYGVTVTGVNTMTYIGKKSVRYTKKSYSLGRKNSFKKAVVTLKEGDTIDFFANI